jgi:hypothetical protein
MKPLDLSFEQYEEVTKNSSVVSNESMSGFLAKIQDSLVSTFNLVTFKYNDKAAGEVMSVKYETLKKARGLDFTTTAENMTSTPESFRGKYLWYLRDLSAVTKPAMSEVEMLIDNLKIVIASFINDSANEKIGNIYAVQTFKEAERNLAKYKKDISAYFPANTGKSKARFRDILFTYQDFPHLFDEVVILDTILNHDCIKKLDKNVEDIRGLIDMLIKLTSEGSIPMHNESLKKELVFATYITGRYVEFISYLATNVFTFYGVYLNNCDDLNKL